MLLATGLQALLPFISKSVIDIGIYTQDITFINMMLVGNIVLLLSITLSNIMRNWILMHISMRVNIFAHFGLPDQTDETSRDIL